MTRAKRQQQSTRLLFALRSAPLAALALLAVVCALPFIARTEAAEAGNSSRITHYSSRYSWLGDNSDIYTKILASRNARVTTAPPWAATYFSQGSLDPGLLTSWNTSPGGGGATPPNFTTASDIFIIQSGHNMSTTGAWTVSGGGSTVQVGTGGTLTANNLVAVPNFIVSDGGTYIHNAVGSSVNGSANDVPGSSSRTFGTTSTVEFQKWANGGTGPTGLPSVSWGNLTINVATLGGSWNQSVAASGTFTVNGNFTIAQTGGGATEFRVSNNNGVTLQVTGNFTISGGRFDSNNQTTGPNTYTLNIGGNLNFSGGTWDQNQGSANPGNLLTVNFTGGASSVTETISGTFNGNSLDRINWAIASGKTVQLNTGHQTGNGRTFNVSGTLECGTNLSSGIGTFNLLPGATLGIGDPNGIVAAPTASGNVRNLNRVFNSAANYTYNGTAAQVTGNGPGFNSTQGTVNSLTITNTAGVTLSQNTTTNGASSIGSGATLNTGAFTLTVNNTLANSGTFNVSNGGTLKGTGTVTGPTTVASGGTVAPGASPGILNTGNVSFTSGSNFNVELNGTAVGTQYDQLNVTGSVTLGGATLNVTLGFTPAAGDAFTIINNDDTDPVSPSFAGLPQGATFNISGTTFQISYTGGTGNDVVLTVPPPPDLSIADVSQAEGNGPGTTTMSFTVTRSGDLSGTSTVNYSTTAGTATQGTCGPGVDYESASGMLTFVPTDATESVTVTICGDTTPEPDETFTVNLTSPTNATISDATGDGTIQNDDGSVTYTWDPTSAQALLLCASQANQWTCPGNWTPLRPTATVVSTVTTDILIFDGSVTPAPTILNVPTQSIAAIQFKNNINVAKFEANLGAATLTVNGNTGSDLSIALGSAVRLQGSNPITIALTAAGQEATISGNLFFEGAAHKLTGANAGEIRFESTSIFTTTTGFSGHPFGSGTDGSVIFDGGSQSFFGAGLDPFGGAGKTIVSFGLVPMSSQEFSASSAFDSNGRSYGNLTLTGGQTYGGSGSGLFTVFGNFVLGSTSTLILSGTAGGDMVVNGNFTDNNSSLTAFQSNGRVVTFSGGSTTQTIFKNTIIGEIFAHLNITKTGGSVQLLTSIAINGSLTFGGTAGSAVDVLELNTRSVSLAGSISAMPDANSGFKGDLNGAGIFTGVAFNAGGNPFHFVSGGEFLSSFGVNTASGVSVDTDLTIGHPTTTPNGILTLTDGIVDMGTKTLTLNPNATVIRTSGHVSGNLKKNFGATGPFNFAVGTANGYSPVGVDVTAGTGDLTVKAVQGQQPNITGANALQRYWILNGTGITADLTFNYLDPTDIPGSANESAFVIFKYDGSFTTPGGTVNTGANTATINGVSQFSDWTLAEPAAVQEGSLAYFDGATSSINEGNAGPTLKNVCVTRSGGTDGAVSVNYATSDGTAEDDNPVSEDNDYVASSGTLNWADNEGGDKCFDVTINGDTTFEPTETINITLSSATGGVTIAQSGHIINVQNDDAPPLAGVAFNVNNTTIGKLNTSNGTVAWSLAQANDGALAMDQSDFGVYTGKGGAGSGSGTGYKYNAGGGFAWSGALSTGTGFCSFYYVNGAAVDVTSGTPGVVFTEGSCFGAMAKANRLSGSQIWAITTNDIQDPTIDPANGQVYAITYAGGPFNQIYSVTTGGSASSFSSCQGLSELNPADGNLYRGGNMGTGGCGLQLSQLNKALLPTPNWNFVVPGITSFDSLALQPWSGGYIYVGSVNSSKVVVVDPATQTVVRSFNTAVPPSVIAVDPTGGTLYISDSATNFVRAYSPHGTLLWTSPNLGGPVYGLATPKNVVGTPPNEADYCNLQFPTSFSVPSGGVSPSIFGRVFEAGITPPLGSDPSITAQVGFGPLGSDPRTGPGNGWTWFSSSFNTQVGNDDEYVGTFTAPAVGVTTQFSYTYRFSFDNGANYTYADIDGNGTNVGLSFSTEQLGTMTVTATGETDVVVSGGNLVITDSNGGTTNDTLTLSLVSGPPRIRVTDPNNALACGAGTTQFDPNTCDIPQGSVTGNIQVNTLAGNDALTLNFASGNFVPASGLIYNGGAQSGSPGDSLTVTGGSNNTITHTFNNANDGSIQIDTISIQYTGLEPVTDNMAAVDRVFTFNAGPETITLSDAAGANMTIDSNVGGESVTFANPTGSLIINAGTGNDTVTIASVDTNGPYNVDLTINGDSGNDTVNVNADITFAANENLNVDLTNDATLGDEDAISVGANANLVLSGTGSAIAAVSRNIALASGSSIITANGNLTLSANQQVTPTSGTFFGIDVNAATVQVTGNGTLALNGKGGNAGGIQIGVHVRAGGVVQGGTSGALTVQGAGGAGTGTHNYGVDVTNAGSTVTSSGASVQITGQGGGSGTATHNIGVIVDTAALVSAGGSGTVTVQGTGGASSGDNNWGVYVSGNNATITSGGGNVQVTGIEGVGPSSVAILTDNTGTITTATNGGTVTLIANSMSFSAATISAQSGSSVTLRQRTNGVAINLGAATDPTGGPLSLSDAELDLVTAGTLNIGDNNSGAISVSGAISQTGKITNLFTPVTTTVLSGGDLGISGTLTSPLTVNSGGTVRPGTSPGIINSGNLTLNSGSTYEVEINGTTPGTGHDQLNVVGTAVSLGNATLNVSGSHPPVAGDTFVIVNNDGTDAVTGNFTMGTGGTDANGGTLAEGDTITNFLGSSESATITYQGGTDSNDVVLTVVAATAPEMDVKGNGISIGDGDNTPSLADGTDFGSFPSSHSFTIENTGTSNLTLSGTPFVQITGPHASDFIVTSQPSSPVTPSGSTTFTIFAGASAPGTRTATVSIANDDSDENPYTFDIQILGLSVLTVTPATTPTATDNDYTRINNAVQAAFNGQTIKLLGAFDWTEANAAASWALGSDGLTGGSNSDDDYGITPKANVNSVTFTADNLGDGSIQGPGDLAGVNLEGVFSFFRGQNQNWIISNIRFLDFDLSIGMFAIATTDFNNTYISNNYIRMARDLNATVAPADVNQNIAIHLSFGANQTVTTNTIEIQGDGISAGANFASDVGMQSNTSGGAVYDGLQITNNIVRVLNAQDAANPQVVLGIWENAHGHTSDITISGNQFVNQAGGNNPATNLQRGFRVTSHSSATTTVTYLGNSVNGANIGFQWLAGSNFSGNQPVVVIGNTITNNATGVLVQSQGVANLNYNRIVGNTTGLNNVDGIVNAENNWWGCNLGPGTAGCDTVTGTADFDPWVVLLVSASPSSITPGGTSTVTADMTRNSAAGNPAHGGAATLPLPDAAFSATNGTMFPTTNSFASGQTTAIFTSTNSSNGSACADVDNQQTCAAITVTAPSFTIDDVTMAEGNGGPGSTSFIFTITKTGATAFNASVDYETVDGTAVSPTDFTAIPVTNVTFLPSETTKQVTVFVNGELAVEPDETFTLQLSNASGATIGDASGTGTIQNDDACPPQATVYVDDSWVGTPLGTDPDGGGLATNFGCDSFATIQGGVDGVAVGGTVIVNAGTYNEVGSPGTELEFAL